jgi:hypothetical protein
VLHPPTSSAPHRLVLARGREVSRGWQTKGSGGLGPWGSGGGRDQVINHMHYLNKLLDNRSVALKKHFPSICEQSINLARSTTKKWKIE